ncbi:L-fucose:H+ symporter permease [Paraflavisolibacter sp. H34]|uniref:L-fucose:H+ symporter permease n=1 Tax=Huijunlia imazamoxiresistens TaxID=3127457 RepID=UPI0030162AD2
MKQKAALTEKRFVVTLIFVTSLFMLWGIAITMGDVLNKHFQNVLHVSKAQSSYVQLSIYGAYAVMGIPAGLFMKRFGYKNGVLLGLSLYATGAFLFVPAANAGSFGFFRLALFVLACGLATLETVAHPFAASLGDQRTSDRRLNFAQSFNGLGALIGPFIGSYFLLRAGEQGAAGELASVKMLYTVIGSVIVLLALAFACVKVPKLADPHAPLEADALPAEVSEILNPSPQLFQRRHFVWAVLAQLVNVGAQGGAWAFFINYGVEKMGFSDEKAGYYMILFMAMMMVGRFLGTFLMKYIAPNKLLAVYALGSILSCLVVAQNWGWVSFGALMMINFFSGIMFPTIFSLGLKDLGAKAQQASSFIVMGVVGGAIFPRFMGVVANHDVGQAYYLPIVCHIIIFLFAFKFYQVRRQRTAVRKAAVAELIP